MTACAPLPPTANANQFFTMITRASMLPPWPEAQLALHVLRQAWFDAGSPCESTRDARRFFLDGRVELWAELAGLDGIFLRRIYLDHHRAARAAAAVRE